MGRKKIKRFVQKEFQTVFFKPQGIPMRELERQVISVEELEALRLVDCEGMQQLEAAKEMGVSRPTLSRILSKARTHVATALTKGRAIQIEGGDYHCDSTKTDSPPKTIIQREATIPGQIGRCGQERGRGRGGQKRRRQEQPLAATKQASTTLYQEESMTRIAISSEGPTLEHRVDSRFGRADGFVIVNIDTMKTEYVDNGSSQARSQGAGIQAAETIANAGVNVVLTGYVGPKAFTALSAANISVGQEMDNMTVGEAVEKFKRGEFELAQSANAQSGANK